MRKVQDYYFKKAKKEKYPARSVYKLEEAQQKHKLLHSGDAVLDLGCAPGSWSMYAARAVGPQGTVVGVDLQECKPFTVAGGATVHLFQGDVTDADMLARIRAIGSEYDAVLSDIAPRTSGNKWVDQQLSLRLSRTVFGIATALLKKGGNFYCKVFEGEDVKEFIDEVRGHFKSTRIVNPKSSRNESREIFILGLGFLARPGTGLEQVDV